MITYSSDFKVAYFDNLKFTRDDKTGYFLYSSKRLRLHRAVWEKFNGEIPLNYHIHHKDENKRNNNIDNLELLSSSEHLRIHAKDRVINNPEWLKRFNLLGREEAKKWHSSKEGLQWHSEHGKRVFENLPERLLDCQNCGKQFKTKKVSGAKFCSNSCKSKNRRKLGLDNIKKNCINCDKEFSSNKYSGQRTCSRKCSNQDKALLSAARISLSKLYDIPVSKLFGNLSFIHAKCTKELCNFQSITYKK